MSEQGSEPGTSSGRLIHRVAITYRLENDPEGAERTLVLEHGSGGEVVDGIVWSEELMRKIAYLENEQCVEPKKGPGSGDWKVYHPGEETPTQQTYDSNTASLTETRALTDADVAAGETQNSEAEGTDCYWIHQPSCEWERYCPSEPS